jgi:addiction module RelB/DinJ family antitoxin
LGNDGREGFTMVRDGIVNVRVSKKTREEAEQFLNNYGITVGDAVNMLLHQIVNHKGLPFELRPTPATMKAIRGIQLDESEGGYSNVDNIDELFQN